MSTVRLTIVALAMIAFACIAAYQTHTPDRDAIGEQLRTHAREGDLSEVERALASGASVDQPDAFGMTALMEASRAGKDACVRRLLIAGADVNACTPGFGTSLIQATMNHHVSTIALLLSNGADPNLHPRRTLSALFWAKDTEEPAAVDLIKRSGGKD
jgi:ankyrin repeat protein